MTIGTYENLFRDNYEPLTRYAFSLMKNQQDAEDVVQRLFIKFWEKRDDLRDVLDMRAYLFRSTYNTCLNELKRLQRLRSAGSVDDVHVAHGDDASHRILGMELTERIETATAKLPEKCQEVFRLSRFEELSYKEISERLNISVKTVENHMVKALRCMREDLVDYLPLLVLTILLSKSW